MQSSCITGSEEIHGLEAIEFFEIFGTTQRFKGFDHDEILSMLESGVLDVLDGLEERRSFPVHLSLLFCFLSR